MVVVNCFSYCKFCFVFSRCAHRSQTRLANKHNNLVASLTGSPHTCLQIKLILLFTMHAHLKAICMITFPTYVKLETFYLQLTGCRDPIDGRFFEQGDSWHPTIPAPNGVLTPVPCINCTCDVSRLYKEFFFWHKIIWNIFRNSLLWHSGEIKNRYQHVLSFWMI